MFSDLGDRIRVWSARLSLLVNAKPGHSLLQFQAIPRMADGVEEWIKAGRCFDCHGWNHGENGCNSFQTCIGETRYEGYRYVRDPGEEEQHNDASSRLCYAHLGRRAFDGFIGAYAVYVHFSSLE